MLINQNERSQETFIELHNRYKDRLVHSMIGIVRDRNTAEDIAATAFAKALRSWTAFVASLRFTLGSSPLP